MTIDYCYLSLSSSLLKCALFFVLPYRGTRAITPTAPTLLHDLVYRCPVCSLREFSPRYYRQYFNARCLETSKAALISRNVSFRFGSRIYTQRKKKEEEKISDQSRSRGNYVGRRRRIIERHSECISIAGQGAGRRINCSSAIMKGL